MAEVKDWFRVDAANCHCWDGAGAKSNASLERRSVGHATEIVMMAIASMIGPAGRRQTSARYLWCQMMV